MARHWHIPLRMLVFQELSCEVPSAERGADGQQDTKRITHLAFFGRQVAMGMLLSEKATVDKQHGKASPLDEGLLAQVEQNTVVMRG